MAHLQDIKRNDG